MQANIEDPVVAHAFARRDLIASALTGMPIMALCGAVAVPTELEPDLPRCQPCMRQLALIGAARSGCN